MPVIDDLGVNWQNIFAIVPSFYSSPIGTT